MPGFERVDNEETLDILLEVTEPTEEATTDDDAVTSDSRLERIRRTEHLLDQLSRNRPTSGSWTTSTSSAANFSFDDEDDDEDDIEEEITTTVPQSEDNNIWVRADTLATLASNLPELEAIQRRDRVMSDSERAPRRPLRATPQRVMPEEPIPPADSRLRIQDMNFEFMTWQSDGFDRVANNIYPFFSRHGDRHYSEATMRQLADVPHQLTEWRSLGSVDRLHSEMPVLCVASMPFSYDEDSEVKTGGTTGLLVVFPHKGFKAMLAVHRNGRRRKVAHALWQNVSYRTPQAVFWVHRSNTDGQHFLLSLGFFPTAMNSSGSIRYAQTEEDE